MTSSLDLIRGRQVVQTLTNQSGGAIIAGDVVIVSAANDESFTTTTSAAYNSTRVGVAQESIAAAATGRVLLEGYAPLVNVSASATRGHYLLTHTVAKQATSQAGYAAGAFGQIIKAGTTPSAVIFPVAQVGSSGVTRSGSTTDNHLAVWNGSNADSIKDGGVASSGAMVRISQTVVGVGGVASVTFSGIAGTYENLILTVTGRGSKAANNIDVYVQFNADTGNNYDTEYVNHQGSNAPSAGELRASAGCLIGEVSAASATANYAGGIRVCFYGYARTVFYKPWTAQSFTIWSTGANTQNYFTCAGMWRNTAAITAIKVYPDANDFIEGTVLTLYGET